MTARPYAYRPRPGDERIWRDFASWCLRRGLRPLPAHPWTLAAYLRCLEPSHSTDDIKHHLQAIGRHHLYQGQGAPHRHGLVRRVATLAAKRKAARKKAVPSLFAETTPPIAPPPEKPPVKDPKRRAMRHEPPLVRAKKDSRNSPKE